MSANLFGERFQVMSFGESHGQALGVVVDGCPAGVEFNIEMLNKDMQRRRPGQQVGGSQRVELDEPEILSGVFEGKTLGTPIAVIVRNQDAKSADYDKIKSQPRIGHADDVWKQKFGHTDHRGGGRASGRETVSRVIAGSIAKMMLKKKFPNLEIIVFANQIGNFFLTAQERNIFLSSHQSADNFIARFPSEQQSAIKETLQKIQAEGESLGGQAEIVVRNVPPSLGQPVFHKLKADLASALMSVGATCSVEIGEGEKAKDQMGTLFHQKQTNQYGGIRGGISTGENIEMKVSFKPTSSILEVAKRGRHDPCIVGRAIPVLESMVALVLADHVLWMSTDKV